MTTELRIVAAREEIVTRLEAISTANGYQTNLGASVRRGWPKYLLLGRDVELPITAIHPSAEPVDDVKGMDMLKSRTEDVEIIERQQDVQPEWFDRALDDVRRALFNAHQSIDGVALITTGSAEWAELEDTGLVRLVLPITIRYSDRYGVSP